jgi:hypothetical protein
MTTEPSEKVYLDSKAELAEELNRIVEMEPYSGHGYISYIPFVSAYRHAITLDGEFTIQQLEAVLALMKSFN